MNSRHFSLLGGLLATSLVAGCETAVNAPPNAAAFGEPNRQTNLAQIIDPDPQYDSPVRTSAEHAAQAIERYRTDQVKRPARIRTASGSGGGGGGGSSGN